MKEGETKKPRGRISVHMWHPVKSASHPNSTTGGDASCESIAAEEK
jgi:hypothetical protein